jgi:glycosyltransferase involved in cell wall biosynthesis
MKICAVIIPCYDVAEYIGACINSMMNQKPRENWTYDIRIGVDGCRNTAQKIRIPFWFAERNVGAYIMRNSLMVINPADAFAYFDADDVMCDDYLFRSLAVIDAGGDVVMAAKYQCDVKLKPIRVKLQSGGAITFTKKALDAVGGFQPFRCAGDTDFMMRLEMAGFKIYKIQDPLYYRRCHPKQLTQKTETGIGSYYRRRSWAQMCIDRGKGIVKINPEITKLIRRIP